MVLNRRPRRDSEDIEEINSEDEVHDEDLDESDSEGSSGEEDVQVEESVNHCETMRALLEERDRLIQERIHEERLLREEIARRDAILEDVRRMEERRRQLLQVRARDLEELAALEGEASSDEEIGVEVAGEEETE